MKLFAGLGNPGSEYAFNRHNVGFMAVDAIAAAHGFSGWRKRFGGLAAEGRLGGEQVLLLKPLTYMNRSGTSVGEAAHFYKLDLENVVVFHDELDLPLGKLRMKTGGGVAGHNGLKSISAHLGNDYVRGRIGIGHPGQRERVTKHVLGDFAKAERPLLEAMLGAIADAAPLLAEDTAAKFQTRVAHLVQTAAETLPQPAATAGREAGPAAEGFAGKIRRWFGA